VISAASPTDQSINDPAVTRSVDRPTYQLPIQSTIQYYRHQFRQYPGISVSNSVDLYSRPLVSNPVPPDNSSTTNWSPAPEAC